MRNQNQCPALRHRCQGFDKPRCRVEPDWEFSWKFNGLKIIRPQAKDSRSVKFAGLVIDAIQFSKIVIGTLLVVSGTAKKLVLLCMTVLKRKFAARKGYERK
jgi:hypothetical protein